LTTADKISTFRSDLKDLVYILYVPITLWLVLVTRNMATISINAQRALHRPELKAQLVVTNETPTPTDCKCTHLETISTEDSEFAPSPDGVYVFLLINNLYGGGKAIRLNIDIDLIATDKDKVELPRKVNVHSLLSGDALALYIYTFTKPSTDKSKLSLKMCTVSYTNPFDEASKAAPQLLAFNNKNTLMVTGNHSGAVKLGEGLHVTPTGTIP
jgi:hypothetical protein